MPLRALATKPKRAAVLAEADGCSGIDSFSKVYRLGILASTQRRQNALGRKWRLVQADADRIVNGVGNGGYRRRQRAFAAFLRAEWSLWIHALHNNRLDFRRLG